MVTEDDIFDKSFKRMRRFDVGKCNFCLRDV